MPIDPNLITAIANGTGWFTTLVKVTALASLGGDEIRFALHTRDITFDGDVYEAMSFVPSKMQMLSGVQTDNASIAHMLDGEFSKRNIRGGIWQGATVEIMLIDYLNPGWGYLRRHVGRVGEIRSMGKMAETEFRSLTSLLLQEIGDKTSKRCRYTFGDANCGVTAANYTFGATVTSVVNNQIFAVNLTSIPSGVTNGLLGKYYGGTEFEQYVGFRRDPNVNFTFGATPFPGLSADGYSVRWEGEVKPEYTETYYFSVEHDDGIKFWVNGNLVIDQWAVLGTHESAGIALTANVNATIKLEYHQGTGPAICKLRWRSTTIVSATVIPSNRCYAPAGSTSEPYLTDYFKYGKAIWLTGLNAGLQMETIQSSTAPDITLFLPMSNNIVIGDTLNLVAGDDKTLQMCHNRFNNAINHGGEDCMPNISDAFRVPE